MNSILEAMSPDAPRAPLGLARRIALLVTLLGLIATACGGPSSTTTSADTADASAEALLEGQFEAFADRQVDLEALQGQDVVLWFWAPW